MKKTVFMIACAFVFYSNASFAIAQQSGTGIKVLVSGVPAPTHLVERGTDLFWTESSETPIRKVSKTGGIVTALARRIGVPENVVVHGEDIFWIEARSGFAPSGCVGQGVIWILNKSSLDGTLTEALAVGDNCRDATADMVVDEMNVYWVNSVVSPDTYTIEKVPIAGGISTTLVSTSTRITAIARDATHLYWQEEFFPDPGVIKKMPLGGGEITVVFASDFNPLVGGFAIHGTEIVFADRGFPESYRLLKVSISGGPVTVLADLAGVPRKIVADDTNVYWIDASTVNSIPVNGGDITTLASELDSPVDLEFDTASLYWTETVCCAHGQKGSIKTVPITGGTVTVLVDGVDAPGALALDASNIYWTEGGPIGEIEGFGRIAKVPIGGGAVTTWAGGISSAMPPIAVDDTNVYTADNFTIKKVPIDGGTVEKLIIASDHVGDLTTDGINVYWIEELSSFVYKIPVDGGTVVTLSPELTGMAGPIEVDNTHVYWMTNFDTIKKVPISGGSVVTIATDLPFLSDLAVDGTNVYFSEQDTGNIRKVSVNGGAITTLANGLSGSWNILALDQLNVYWIDQVHVGTVPKGGGTVTYIVPGGLVSEATIPNGIAVDQAAVYWTEVRGGTIKVYSPLICCSKPTLQTPSGEQPTYQWSCGDGQWEWFYVYVQNLTTGALHGSGWIYDPGATTWTQSYPLPWGSYRAWVRVYHPQCGYSQWSDPVDWTVGDCCAKPQLSTVDTTGADPVISWLCTLAEWQYAYVYLQNLSTNAVRTSGWLNGVQQVNQWTATGLPWGNYRVWVRVWHSQCGYSEWSDPVDFAWGNCCGKPSLDPPSGDPTTFQWDCAGGEWTYFYVYVLNLSTSGVCGSGWQPSSVNAWTQSLPWGSYRAWIQVYHPDCGFSQWSNSQDFTVGNCCAKPTLSVNVTDTTPTYSWSCTGAEWQYAYVYLQNLSTGAVVTSGWLNGTQQVSQWTPTGLPWGDYRAWVIVYHHRCGYSEWSDPVDLVTCSCCGKPELATPSGNPPRYQWSCECGEWTWCWVYVMNPSTGAYYGTGSASYGWVNSPDDFWDSIYTLPAGSYRAWVRVYHESCGLSEWSDPMDFTVLAP